MERSDVVEARYHFLHVMKTLTSSEKPIVYLDETWINQNYTVSKCWVDGTSDKAQGIRVPTGKGGRWIILHAGTKNGFIPGAALIFKAKNTGDYHDQMNSDSFEKWWTTQLIPNIPPSSIIVMDNASYHSRKKHRPPTNSSNKAVIREWLEKKGVTVPEGLRKVPMMQLVASHVTASDTNYVTDTIASEHGHRVVRLPPYHCQYNPIELIWAQLKGYVSKKNTFRNADMMPLINEALGTITAENWRNAVTHAEQIQAGDMKRDLVIENFVDSFNITLTSSDDDSC